MDFLRFVNIQVSPINTGLLTNPSATIQPLNMGPPNAKKLKG